MNVVEDPELVAELRSRGIGLTCCPISNRFVTGDLKATEIAVLLRSGVRVTSTPTIPRTSAATSWTTTWRWPRRPG